MVDKSDGDVKTLGGENPTEMFSAGVGKMLFGSTFSILSPKQAVIY